MMQPSDWFERDLLGDTSSHDCGNEMWLASSAKAAMSSRIGHVMALVLLVTSAAIGSWGLVLLIPLLLFAVFTVKLLNGKARQSAIRASKKAPIQLPDSAHFADGTARTLLLRLEKARQAVNAVEAASPHEAAFRLSGTLERVPEIERHVVVLASRVEYLARFLGGSPLEAARIELERLRRQASRGDGAAADGYQLAADQCQARLDSLAALKAELERLAATAEHLLGTLEQLPSRLAALQMKRLEAWDDRSRRALEEVARLDATLRAFDDPSVEGTDEGADAEDGSEARSLSLSST